MFNSYKSRQRYERRRDDDEKLVNVPVTDPGETLAQSIECITRDIKDLSDNIEKQVKYLATRHKLAVDMAKLEAGANTPIKTLEKRLALLNQIEGFGQEIKAFTNENLEDRIALIEAIKRLEPGETAPIKKLRERVRLLRLLRHENEVAEHEHPDSDAEEVA